MFKVRKMALAAMALAAFLMASCATKVEDLPDFSEKNQELFDQITAERENAIQMEAEQAVPVLFKSIEIEYEAAKTALDNKNLDQSLTLNELLTRYQALSSIADATSKKKLIDQNSYAKYDQSSYEEGNSIIWEFANPVYVIASGDDILQKGKTAQEDFDKVIQAAEKALADEAEKAKADAEKAQQDALNAQIAEMNQAAFKDVLAKRQEAIKAGAEKANPALFKTAELECKAAEKILSDGVDQTKALKELAATYQALETLAKAKEKKALIEENQYQDYNKNAYSIGCNTLAELENPLMVAKLGSTLLVQANKADSHFEQVLDSAYRALSKEARTKAFQAKKDADSVKASVSRKAEYDEAVKLFQKGDSQYVTKNIAGSIESYQESGKLFTLLFTEISDARAAVQARIDAAKAKVSASENIAAEADKEKPLTEKVNGIEDKDAKLLSEDDFSADAESFVDLSETLEEDNSEVFEK